MDVEMTILTIITHSGDARSSSMEAIIHAKKAEFKEAQECIEEAENKLSLAHKEQTKLIQTEAQGKKHDISLLLIHAQDHLMNAVTVKDMASEFVELYISINA